MFKIFLKLCKERIADGNNKVLTGNYDEVFSVKRKTYISHKTVLK